MRVLVPLRREHVRRVARLHCSSLTGLLSRLGPVAARAYYTACTRSSAAAGFVVLEEAEVVGFVLGSAHPRLLKREVLRLNPLGTLFGGVCGLLRRPTSLFWLIRSFRGPDEGSYDAEAPELTYLAVAEGARGHGVGRQLVDAFTAAMRDAGLQLCELSVDEDNGPARAFYEKLEFRLVGDYREFGVSHKRYRLVFRPRDSRRPSHQ